MKKIECLENAANGNKGMSMSRDEFWAAFGEVAPPKTTKWGKFKKRFIKSLPDACAAMSMRLVLIVSVLSVAGIATGGNPLRILVSKFI